MTTLNIIDGDLAKSWQTDVEHLNEETKTLLEDVGKALQEVQQDADSTIVDEIYKYGGQILSGATQVMEGMNKLVHTVTDILSALNNVLDTGKNIVKGAVNALADAIF